MRSKIFEVIDPTYSQGRGNRAFNIGMLILIFLNVLAVIMETEENLYIQYKNLFDSFEIFSVTIFSIEYIFRLWTCTTHEKFSSPFLGRIKYAFSPSMLIDLISILPFYIPMGGMDLRFIRAVRLFRLFRLFKMGRYSQSLTKLGHVIKTKKEELIITLFSGIILLILASSLMYFVEREAQPDAFGSIPKSMWWGAVTLTNVGYGDVYPITTLGRILGALIAVLGIGLFALPAGIIASGFAAELQKPTTKPIKCPHCGKEFPSSENLI